jgi:hypothetical protein
MESFRGLALDMPFLKPFNNIQLLNKESLGVWNMFPLHLPKHIHKNVSCGLKN